MVTNLQFKNQGTKTRTSNAAVSDAAYQVALATRAIVSEDSTFSEKLGNSQPSPPAPWNARRLFPVIVTTAKLFVCEFDPNNVSPITGEIEYARAALTEASQLVYEYPLPPHLQYEPRDLVAVLKGEAVEKFRRMHVLVVQSVQLANLLQTFYAVGDTAITS